MDQCGGFNPVQYNVQGSADTRAQAHPISRLAQPYILDPDLGAMYSAPSLDHPSFPTYTEPSTSSYSPTPSEMAITPDSSDFPSPADSAFSPFIMDIPTPTSSAPEPVAKKPSHSKKRPAGHIPRPRNAFILFRSHHVAAQLIPGKVENDHRHISKIIGEIWNKLSPAERLIWEQKADIEKERHSRKYPGYRYKPAKLDGVVKRRVKCRGAPALSAYSSSPGIGKANGAQEIIGSLNVAEGGVLSFGNSERPRLIDQEERRKDKARCVRVAQLIQQGVVGKHLEEEAQRLGLDRDSVTSATPQLQPSAHETPGTRCQFHTNVDILRVLEEENAPVFTDPFAPNNPSIPRPDVMHPLNSGATGSVITNYSPTHTFTSLAGSDENSVLPTTVSPPSQVNDSLRGWSYRRASSLPLDTSSPLPSLSAEHANSTSYSHQRQSNSASPMPTRLVGSPLRRHHRLYYPHPHRERAQKQTSGRDSDSSLSAFDRLSYYSPGNSPPEQHLTPHIHPRLHFKNTTSRSNLSSVNPISHINSTPTLYGINSTRPWRSEEPIDLSAMYEQDNATGNEATLHSTYAINTGKAYPPIPTAPAPLGDVPISHQLALSCKPAHNHTTGSEFDVESGPSQSYYDWPSQYGSELNYPPGDDYNASANPEIYKEVPNMYYSNTTGDLPY
ncbi:high mobility group, partial [Rhizoctonia solani]